MLAYIIYISKQNTPECSGVFKLLLTRQPWLGLQELVLVHLHPEPERQERLLPVLAYLHQGLVRLERLHLVRVLRQHLVLVCCLGLVVASVNYLPVAWLVPPFFYQIVLPKILVSSRLVLICYQMVAFFNSPYFSSNTSELEIHCQLFLHHLHTARHAAGGWFFFFRNLYYQCAHRDSRRGD